MKRFVFLFLLFIVVACSLNQRRPPVEMRVVVRGLHLQDFTASCYLINVIGGRTPNITVPSTYKASCLGLETVSILIDPTTATTQGIPLSLSQSSSPQVIQLYGVSGVTCGNSIPLTTTTATPSARLLASATLQDLMYPQTVTLQPNTSATNTTDPLQVCAATASPSPSPLTIPVSQMTAWVGTTPHATPTPTISTGILTPFSANFNQVADLNSLVGAWKSVNANSTYEQIDFLFDVSQINLDLYSTYAINVTASNGVDGNQSCMSPVGTGEAPVVSIYHTPNSPMPTQLPSANTNLDNPYIFQYPTATASTDSPKNFVFRQNANATSPYLIDMTIRSTTAGGGNYSCLRVDSLPVITLIP